MSLPGETGNCPRKDKPGPLRACLGGAGDFALATPPQTPLRFFPCRRLRRKAAEAAAGKEAVFLGIVVVHNHRSTDARSAGAEVLNLRSGP